jgi:hypothetical protein
VPGPIVPMIPRRAALLRTLGLDIAGPLVVFAAARSVGTPQVWALVISGAPPAVGVFIDWMRWRTLDVVASVVLGGITLNVTLALATGNTKAVLLDGAAMTAAFGVLCWISLMRRRPLIFYFAQTFYGGPHSAAGAEMDTEYDSYSEARSFWRTVTTVWGIAYAVEALALAAIVEVADTITALAVNKIVPWLLSGALMAWAFAWGSRLRAEKPSVTTDDDLTQRPNA